MMNQGRLLVDSLRVRFDYGSGRIEAIVAERAGAIARKHCVRARDDLFKRLESV